MPVGPCSVTAESYGSSAVLIIPDITSRSLTEFLDNICCLDTSLQAADMNQDFTFLGFGKQTLPLSSKMIEEDIQQLCRLKVWSLTLFRSRFKFLKLIKLPTVSCDIAKHPLAMSLAASENFLPWIRWVDRRNVNKIVGCLVFLGRDRSMLNEVNSNS